MSQTEEAMEVTDVGDNSVSLKLPDYKYICRIVQIFFTLYGCLSEWVIQ